MIETPIALQRFHWRNEAVRTRAGCAVGNTLEDINAVSLESSDLPGTSLNHRCFVRGHNFALPAGRLQIMRRCLSGSRGPEQRVEGCNRGARKSPTRYRVIT